MTSFFKKTVSSITALALVGGMALPLFSAHAAQITTASDILSTLKTGVGANHEIKFVVPSGVGSGETLSLTNWGNTFDDVSTISEGDADFAIGSTGNCSSATFTEQGFDIDGGSDWVFANDGQTMDITSIGGSVPTGRCVRVRIGTNATAFSRTPTAQMVNPAANSNPGYPLQINTTDGDSTSIAIPILTDNEVQVTASVTPQISFALSENSLQFGTLTVGNDRYATNAGGNTSETAGLVLTTSTNAANGYNITVLGNTLTSTAGYTVDAIGGTAANLTSGEKFGLRADVTSGTGTETTPYNTADYAFTAGSAQQLVSATTPVNTTTVDVYYGANISATTQAADYSTTHTYVVTGNF
jgi:hypothetical protein